MSELTKLLSGPTGPEERPRRSGRLVIALIVVLTVGLAGVFVTQAVSQEGGFGPWHDGWHHGGFMGGPGGDASIEEHADRMVQHLAIEIDATAEQQEKLRAIVTAAVKDLQPVHELAQAAHQQVHDLLTQPTIDRAALEKIRSEQITLWDAASKRITQAIGDAAEVLTPEQRQKLGKLMSHGQDHG
jgi:Spy/CpxP family protein refolding chaperone